MDSAAQGFVLVKNLGCMCPPAAVLANTQCQAAPIGGYVDIFGDYRACTADTYGTVPMATTEQACAPCPPYTFSNASQSSVCQLCLPPSVPDPSRSACIEQCPGGSRPVDGGCAACPSGQTFAGGACVQCPPNTTSAPGSGIYTCDVPTTTASCLAAAEENITVFTISVLGFRPVDMAVARNGSVYIAAFQLLVLVDRSGSSIQTPIPDLGLVRSLALQPNDERVLYAAITQQEVLCFTSVGSAKLQWTSKVFVPNSVIVGIRTQPLSLWDISTNSVFVEAAPFYRGDAQNLIMAMTTAGGSVYLMLQHITLGNQSVILPSASGVSVLARGVWNPYLALWRGRLVLSRFNAIVGLTDGGMIAGVQNLTGNVVGGASMARFTGPGPMSEAPNPDMLLVADQNALRVLYASPACECAENQYLYNAGCRACPVGLVSMQGGETCTTCTQGQYNDAATGACVPCPKARWWAPIPAQPCSPLVDTMVAMDASGLSMLDIGNELLSPSALLLLQTLMKQKDYVSLQTLVLPLMSESVMQDAAANARFWMRLARVTPLPTIYISTQPSMALNVDLPLELPGFWVECSQYVLQYEDCTCDLPAGRLLSLYLVAFRLFGPAFGIPWLPQLWHPCILSFLRHSALGITACPILALPRKLPALSAELRP